MNMIEEVNFNLDYAREQMNAALVHLDSSLSKIRAGKANPQMLRNVSLEYYGSNTPLSQLANISTPDASTITIQPFDKNNIPDIEQAILDSELGFNPSNNGEKVIINVPPLTEERRRDLVRQAKNEVENSKISIRSLRQKANDEMKKLAQQGISEDMLRDAEQSVQDLTNEYVSKIDKMFEVKEADILKV